MSLFDGMAGLLAGGLGKVAVYTPKGGAARDVRGVFREAPTEAVDQDGHPVLIVAPTWRVQRNLVPEIQRGDRLEPGNGRIYLVQSASPSGSPAEDGFLICELERIFA